MSQTVSFRHADRTVSVVQHTQRYTHFQVSSSRPDRDPYDVVVRGDDVRCACRGNLFRGDCSHAAAVRAVLNQD